MNDWPTRAEIVAEAHTDVVNDTQRPCVHEWGFIAERTELTDNPDRERWVADAAESDRKAAEGGYALARGPGPLPIKTGRMIRRWFCVHCRTVEETIT